MATDVDVVILGLGPGGERAAGLLAGGGLEVVGVEAHLVGGECRYYGCTPSKMLIRSAAALAEVRRAADLAGRASATPNWRSVADRISSDGTHDWHDDDSVRGLEDHGVRVVHGQRALDGPGRVVVGDETFVARRGVIVATGTDPAEPAIAGLGQTPYLTNREVFKIRLASGVADLSRRGSRRRRVTQALTRFGVRVTLIEAGDRILAAEEPEVSQLLPTGCARRVWRSWRKPTSSGPGMTVMSSSPSAIALSAPSGCWSQPGERRGFGTLASTRSA